MTRSKDKIPALTLAVNAEVEVGDKSKILYWPAGSVEAKVYEGATRYQLRS